MNSSNNTTNSKGFESSGDKAAQKFSEMMIERLNSIKASDWKQGWTNGKGMSLGMPQNLSGRNYSGTNSFFLQMDTATNGYDMPVYMTFLQVQKEGLRINKGAKAMPVVYWDLNIRNADGKRISENDYRLLSKEEKQKCEVHPYLRAFNVFNIAQTNMQEVKPERYEALKDRFRGPQLRDTNGMYENRALDRMIERQEWVCRIQADRIFDGACYSPSRDIVIVPKKEQFNIGKTAEEIYKDGMEYYSSLLHEMAHSTGTVNRLNREKGGKFGDAKYAKEELVAELTAAMVGNSMGFDKRILNNNAAYTQGWINALREEPKFIVSVMADVNKASKMILEKIDEQKIALGERPILSANTAKVQTEDTSESMARTAPRKRTNTIATNVDFDDISIMKKQPNSYVIHASYEGKDLGTKPLKPIDGVRHSLLPEGLMKEKNLHDLAARAFAPEIGAIREIKNNLPEGVSATMRKAPSGEYLVTASVGGRELEPKVVDRKIGNSYNKMADGVQKVAVLSNIVKEAYGDQLKNVPRQEQQRSRGLKL